MIVSSMLTDFHGFQLSFGEAGLDIDHHMRADLQCFPPPAPPPRTSPFPGLQLDFTPGRLCCTASFNFHESDHL